MSIVSRSTQQYSGFDPRSIPGCVLWLDAADSFTVTGTNPVTAWADKSGNGNNTTSYTGSPTLNTNAINGRRAISFNGTGGFFGNLLNSLNTLSVFFIGTHASTSFGRAISLGNDGQLDWNTVQNINALSGNNNGVQVAAYRNGSALMTFTPSSSTSPFIYDFVINGSTFNAFVNGSSIASTGSSGNFGYSRYGIGTQVGTQTLNWTGLIGEVIIFNTALTSFERQQIEGYLAWKWGLYTNLPTGHPFRPNPVFTRPFQPIDIDGCALWLDAADASTISISSINNISQWRDKSSSGLTGTAVNSPGYFISSINGLPAVVFSSGTQYIDYGNNLNLGTSGVYVFTVAKYDNASDGAIIGKSSARGLAGRWSLLRISGSTDMLADGTGSGVQSGYADTSTLTQLISGYWDRSNVVIRQNGTQRNSIGLSSSTNLSTSDSLFVGAYQSGTGGAPPTSGLYFIGKIGEIIVYIPPNPLTVNQIQRIESYLAAKWGLQSTLPTTVTNPTIIPNLSLWLDATDPNGNGILPANNDVITSWKDKSGSGNNLNGLNSPRWLASPSRMSITGTAYFTGSGPTSYNMTAFFVYIDANTHCGPIYTANDPGSTDVTGIFPNCAGTTFVQTASGWATQGSTIPKNVVNILVLQYNSAFNSNNVKVYLNGALNMTASSAPFTRTSFTLGRRVNEYLQGSYYEALFYSTVLTDNQRNQVESYLGMKWGISSSSLSTQPYFALRAPLTSPIFTPTSLSGLRIWNDASILTQANGTSLSTWTNTGSGGTINCTGTVVTNGLNGLRVVRFTTSQTWTTSVAVNLASHSFFFVSRQRGGTNSRVWTGSANQLYGYWGGRKRTLYIDNNPNHLTTANAFSDTVWDMFSLTRTAGGPYIFKWQGNTQFSGSTSSANNMLGLFINAGPYGSSETSDCEIAEAILYDSVLTVSQVTEIEGYLAWKWGLQNNLPTTHPYRKFRS